MFGKKRIHLFLFEGKNCAAIGALSLMVLLQSCSLVNKDEPSEATEGSATFSSKACLEQNTLLKTQLKRLTLAQFKNSLISVFGDIFSDSQLPNFGDSNLRLGLGNDPELLRINEINFQSLFASANSLSATILEQNLQAKACIEAADDTCIQNLIKEFGPKLYRRPLTNSDLSDLEAGLSELTQNAASKSTKIEYLLSSLILSPNHLFRTEIGIPSSSAGSPIQLTDYEIASALSFAVWDYPPDEILTKLAAEKSLSDVAVLKEQVQRMLADPRSSKKLAGFVTDVLKIDSVTSAAKDPSFHLTLAERTELLKSAELSLLEIFSKPDAHLMTPFTLTNFYVNDQTARFFNLEPSSFSGGPISSPMNPDQRFGILSHPAFLTSVSGEIGSGIVKRGVFAIEQLLCHELPPPPPSVQPIETLPPGFDPNLASTRQLLTISHSGQQSCIGCHKTIDPVGFAFENFDAIGQFRLFEKENVPINASGRIVKLTTDQLIFKDSVDFFKMLSNTPEFKQCMTKKYFHYISGQSAQEPANQCEFNSFNQKISSRGETVEALLESIIELESFTKRSPAGN